MNSITSAFMPNAANMTRRDHTQAMATFHQTRISHQPQARRGLANTVCLALEVHARPESAIFYPAVRKGSDHAAIRTALPGHAEMKRPVALPCNMQPGDAR